MNSKLQYEVRTLGRTATLGRFLPLHAVGLLFLLCSGTAAAQEPPQLELQPCRAGSIEARCGVLEVFENRAAKSGRKIPLRVVVLPATESAQRVADPVFLLVGGPGQGAAEAAQGAGPQFLERIRRARDVVLVDQRGTGASNPLRCNLYGDPDDMSGYFTQVLPLESLVACREELARNAELALYTTPLALEDLDDVRAALNYTRVNLFGGSYGTQVALAYLRKYPQRVRSMVISSVAPMDYRLPLPIARGFQQALERVFADCEADASCHAAFPRLREEFAAVLVQLEAAPVKQDAPNPVTRRIQQVEITREAVLHHLRLLLYSTENIRAVPLMIHMMAQGDFGFFAFAAFQHARNVELQIARGQHLTVVCSEHVPFISERDIRRQTAGTWMGDSLVRRYQQACRQWPRGQVSATFLDDVKSHTPALLLSGELDPVTPPSLGARVARNLPRSKQIVLIGMSHTIASECADRLAAEFIE
ncbi:MAG TPA: alpha/beta fold hydrolase, partial [Candidatus Nitrosotenuis sp.]|nr:alpha/beta fold hydrolase [Candidatus Nitrosotenuis sp.]